MRKFSHAAARTMVGSSETRFFQGVGSATLAPCPESRANVRHPHPNTEQLLGKPWPFPGRPPKHDLETWTVTDDWPDGCR